MNIFDREITQSFADLESRIVRPTHDGPSVISATSVKSPTAGSDEDEDDDFADLPPPPPTTSSLSVRTDSSSRNSAASVTVSGSNTPSSSTPLNRMASASTATGLSRLELRRGSDFRQRIGSSTYSSNSLHAALSPGSGNHGTLTKAKCQMPGCTAFSARNNYCLRHVWRLSVEELEPVNQKQYQVAKEIVTTEKSYSDGLRIIYKSFLLRITTQNDMTAAAGDGKPLLDASEITRIFHNIEDLYKLAENLYLDLEEITLEKVLTTQIGTTLLHYAPQFRIYQSYLENYDDAIKTLGQVRREKAEFDFFCRLQEKCEGMSLESFLIMPVQRLPRYLLLLSELIKRSEQSTSVSEGSLADMNQAKEKIGNIAASINASLHQKESQLKVLAIQQKFEKDARYQELATPTRYLIRDGPLKKRYGKGTRHLSSSTVYHFFLFNDILVYADFKKDVIGKGVTYKLKHILPLTGMTLEATSSDKGKNKDISVTTKSSDAKQFDISCADTADRDSWLRDMQAAIEKNEAESKVLKTTSFDGTNKTETLNKSSKLKAMMGV